MALIAVARTMRDAGFHHWLVQWEAAAVWVTATATVGLAIGVVFAWYALRDARQTRHAQLLAEFSRRWDDPEIIASVRLGKEFGPDNLIQLTNKLFGPDAIQPADETSDEFKRWHQNLSSWYEVLKWPTYLETIAVMAYGRALPIRMIYQMWGGPIIDAWNKDWASVVAVHRVQKEDDNIFRYFQWLAQEMERERTADREKRIFYRATRHAGPVGPAILAASSLTREAASVRNPASRCER